MQPQAQSDQFQPKWKHFHPQATVWVLNPFGHDVYFRVADENGIQSEFKIQANERAELPGGAIATLGVKTIIDEMIQNNKDDVLRLHDQNVRAKYEEKIILRIKEAPASVKAIGQEGPIDLSMGGSEEKKEVETEVKKAEPFSSVPVNPKYTKKAEAPVKDIASASLGKKDQIVEE